MEQEPSLRKLKN
ncbi:hypothetical protein AVEN_120203-1, partial [Araneus ventricosus]